jgi:hypothetical protein
VFFPAHAPPPVQLTLLVILGDSIAHSVGVPEGGEFHSLLLENDDQRYPGFSGRDLRSLTPTVRRLDLSRPGARSADVVKQAKSVWGNPAGRTLVILSVGLNEFRNSMWSALDPDKVQAKARELTDSLEKVHAHFNDAARFPDGALLGLLNVWDPTDRAGQPPPDLDHLIHVVCTYFAAFSFVGNLTLFNQHLARFVERRGLFLLDVHGRFLGHGYQHDNPTSPFYHQKDPSLWFLMDCLHANARGNHEIRRLIWETMVCAADGQRLSRTWDRPARRRARRRTSSARSRCRRASRRAGRRCRGRRPAWAPRGRRR